MAKEDREEEVEGADVAEAEEIMAKADPTEPKANKGNSPDVGNTETIEVTGATEEEDTVMTEGMIEAKEEGRTTDREESIKISKQAGCPKTKNKQK